MAGIVVTLTGNSAQYEAMMARSVAIAKASAISIQKEYEKAQLIVRGQTLSALNPLMTGRNAASTIFNQSETKSAAQNYGEWWTEALSKQEAGLKAVRTEMWAANAAVIASAGGAGGLFGGHGGGLTGIIRESLVIMREISMGRGTGRIGGSITLLAQYMGLLNKAVKSTATTAIVAAAAEKTLSLNMAVAAARAKGTAAETELLAAARAQATVATEAQTVADQELAVAQVTLNPIFFATVGAIVAVGAAAFILWRHFRNVAIAAKNWRDIMNPLKKSFTELAAAEKTVAEATQANIDYIDDILKKHNSESDAIERKIKLLKEEADARGLSDRETLKKEQQLLQIEQARLTGERDKAIAAEKAASAEDKGGLGATMTDEKGRTINLQDSQDKTKRLGAVADAVQTAIDNNPALVYLNNQGEKDPAGMKGMATSFQSVPGISDSAFAKKGFTWQQEADALAEALKGQAQSVTVDGQKYSKTIGEVTAAYELSKSQTEQLAADQKHLDDVMKDAKSTLEDKAEALAKVQDDLADIGDQLAHPVKERGSGGNREVTERERIGAAGNMVADRHLAVAQQQLEVSKQTYQLIAGRPADSGEYVGGTHF